ncbi:MAG: hypothetical protein NDJ89_09825 [Oligoflexia bacterium]|nr:hypothetical protein [Oligoflexia bacterium]
MPNLIDYLLAPWKILELLAGGSPAQSGKLAAGGAAASSSGLCSIQDVGGQVLSICRVAGYEMPSFIFWASCIIFLIFAVASLLLFRQCSKLAASLGRVTQQLERAKNRDLAGLRAVLEKEKNLAPLWSQFEDTLLVFDRSEDVYATQPPEAIFSRGSVIEAHVHSSFFNSVPGILTGVGLLMTFVAILDGLSHVTVSTNMDVQGIGGLINGLSGKFVSSIVAVTCAVCFVFVERLAYSGPEQGYRKLLIQLSARFRRRTAEHLLHHIHTELQVLNRRQKTVDAHQEA